MEYYITETEEDALEQDILDLKELKEMANGIPEGYWETTKNWSIPKQRLDGKWVRSVCPYLTRDRLIETDPKDGTWFVIEEELI